MYHTNPEKIRSHRPVPWWMHNQQLALPFGTEPDAAPTAPPRAQHPEASAPDAADAPCPDMLPRDVRETYESVFGLPALYAEASCPDADERPLADMDTPRAEVVA
jgi:hypothetical protein